MLYEGRTEEQVKAACPKLYKDVFVVQKRRSSRTVARGAHMKHRFETKAQDRRIEKTRRALHSALISLMTKKDYREITTQEITDEANVGRSTFYTHFDDKDDLLLSGLQDLRNMLENERERTPGPSGKAYEGIIAFSRAMFVHAYAHREVYKTLVRSQAGGLVLQYFPAMLAGLIREKAGAEFRRKRREPTVPLDLFVHFIASAFVSVMSWWLDTDRPLPPDRIDSVFRALLLPTLASHLD